LTKPLRDQDADLVTAYQAMLRQTRGISLLPVNTTVAARVADLRARYNRRTPDALHVATALTSGCDVFLTNDLGLKRVQEVRILILNELEMDKT
jgi:predicted nucleic acid-binding protein